jgi:isoleucyl-tRNA synthetase
MQQLVEAFHNGTVTVGEFTDLPAELFEYRLKSKTEFSGATEDEVTVVLDTTMDMDLINEGTLREIIRGIQVARQDADLEITARIELGLFTTDVMITDLIKSNFAKISEEVLATSIEGEVPGGHKSEFDVAGSKIQVTFKVV